MAHAVHPALGLGVVRRRVDERLTAHLLVHLDLGEAVDGQQPVGPIDLHGDAALVNGGHRAGESGETAPQPGRLGIARAVQIPPDILPLPQGGGGGAHVVLINGGAGGQSQAGDPADVAGEHHGGGAIAGGRHRGDGASGPGVGGVGGQLGVNALGIGEVDSPAEHGGHLRPGQAALGHELVGVIALDNAVCTQQIHIGLEHLGNGGGVGIVQGVAGQVLRHGVQLHGPHQVHGQVLTGDGLEESPGGAHGLQFRLANDAGLQTDGHLLLGPAVDLLGQDLAELFGTVGGDLLFILSRHAGGTGAEEKRFAGGHLAGGGEGGGAGAVDDAQPGQVLHVLPGPVALHVGEAHRPGREHQQGHGQRRGQSKNGNSLSFHSFSSVDCIGFHN